MPVYYRSAQAQHISFTDNSFISNLHSCLQTLSLSHQLSVPRIQGSTLGTRAFSVTGPTSGIHCLIQLLTPNNLGGIWRRICLQGIQSVSTSEVLRNHILQIDIYLLTYLLYLSLNITTLSPVNHCQLSTVDAVAHINTLNVCWDHITETICSLKFNSHIQRQVGSRRTRQEDLEVSGDTDLPAVTTSASITEIAPSPHAVCQLQPRHLYATVSYQL